jgi:hypothetical protein
MLCNRFPILACKNIKTTGSALSKVLFQMKSLSMKARLYLGKLVTALGWQEAVHRGDFIGVTPTDKKMEIRYMCFWKVEEKRKELPIIGLW